MTNDDPYRFDNPPDRSGSWSTKWQKYANTEILPFWVADMEFATAPSIVEAARKRLTEHQIFGYTTAPESITEAAVTWLRRSYGWDVDPNWLLWLPGVVAGFNMACRSVGAPGDQVLMWVPVYHPFLTAPEHAGRAPLYLQLSESESGWYMDQDRIRAALAGSERASLLLFCNPQNPTGRVYRRDELEALRAVCEEQNLIVCSDEIHCGLILDEQSQHIPLASLDPDFAQRTISLFAPSKTFNIPGLGCAFAVIPDPSLRTEFEAASIGMLSSISPVAYAAAEAALREDSDWQPRLLDYLRDNERLLRQRIEQLPRVRMTPVQGTYLAWIDVRALQLDSPGAWFERFNIGMSDGEQFGGPGFVRFNFACPRSMLEQGLERFADAVAAALKRLPE